MSPSIPASAQWPTVAVLAGLTLFVVSWLWVRHVGRNRARVARGEPRKSLAGHIRTYPALHGGALLVLVLAGLIAAGVGVGYAILHHGGFKAPPHFHISPPRRHRVAGGAGIVTTQDLSARWAAIEVAQDQGGTLACCGLAVTRLDAIQRTARGERIPQTQSGYRPWYYVTGGQNVGTTPDDEAAALNAHGTEPLAYWQLGGYPDASDAAHTLRVSGTSVSWDYYVDSGGGQAGLNDIVWRLSHGTPVGIIWAVHHDGDAAQNVAYTWDGGGFFYEHCLVAVQYTSNYPGIGPAVKVWNTYGLRYGIGGYIWLPAAVVESHVQGAFVETPGPPVAAWLPAPPPAPTAVIALPPTPAPTRTPLYWGVYVVTRSSNLRASPMAGAHILRGLPRGTRLRALGRQQASYARASEHGLAGWVPLAAVTRSMTR